jgi:hypothetical protein
LPGMRPCRPPKPAVSPFVEDDEEGGDLSAAKWVGKIVRRHGTDVEGLALVEDVFGGQLALRWASDGRRQHGPPEKLLGELDERTFVSDSLSGTVEAQNLDTLEVMAIGPGEDGSLSYLVDNGEERFRMPVHQLIRAVEARRQHVIDANEKEAVLGEYIVQFEVNGQPAASEVLKIVTPFGAPGVGTSKEAKSLQLDWKRDWSSCVRALRFRGVDVDPSVHAALVEYVPTLQELFVMMVERRRQWERPPPPPAEQAQQKAPAPAAAATGAAGAMAMAMPPAAAPSRGGSSSSAVRPPTQPAAATAAETQQSPSTLYIQEWWDMCKQLKLTHSGTRGLDPPLSQGAIDDLLPSHVLADFMRRGRELHDDESGAAADDDDDDDGLATFQAAGGATRQHVRGRRGMMSFDEFIEGLVMVAARKFSSQPLSVAVERLVKEHLVKHGVSGSTGKVMDLIVDRMREELRRSEDCRLMLRQLNKPLRDTYRFWCGASNEGGGLSECLTCADMLSMLKKAQLVGSKISPPTFKSFAMLTLFEVRTCGFGPEHDAAPLSFGDFVELLARCTVEFFGKSPSVETLAEQLRLVIQHTAKTAYQGGGPLPPLKV